MSNFELLQNRLSFSHLPALDGLRFVAVFLVIFYHFGFENVPGAHGVMLFFVLSGFLITWLLLKENEKTGTISLKGFFKRRVLRIFPAFYVYALIIILLLLATKKEVPWMHALSACFYFSNYYSTFHPELNNIFSHTWSLAIEEQFYLIFPFFFLLFCRNLKQLAVVIAGIIGAAWIWRAVLVFGLNVSGGYIYSAFETRIDHLLVGCLLAIVLRRNWFEKFWQIVLHNPFIPFMTIAILAVSVYFSLTNIVYKSVVGFAVEPVLMAGFIVQSITFSAQGVWKNLESKPLKFLGTLSYSLYLWQQVTTSAIPTRFADFPVFVQLIATVLVTITVAAISYYLIEMPFLDLKNMSLSEAFNYNLLKLKAILVRTEPSSAALQNFLQQQKLKKDLAKQGEIVEERR
ncbi:MAG: acyltransferase [Pyrinomonadaceae bacterium]|nr:acyltransferase [Pyrinomonadaceae bacterium]